jgi:acetyltransferase-like isoleucine patch superfamily enzyme
VQSACSCLSQPIVIGDECVLGERSALMGLSTMKKGSVLAPMAQGAKGMTFEAGKTYVGNPADAPAVWR